MMPHEEPYGELWSGREIPRCRGKSIFQFLSQHEGRDILKIRDRAMFWFDLTEEDFNYWLGEWRFTRR